MAMSNWRFGVLTFAVFVASIEVFGRLNGDHSSGTRTAAVVEQPRTVEPERKSGGGCQTRQCIDWALAAAEKRCRDEYDGPSERTQNLLAACLVSTRFAANDAMSKLDR